MKLIKRIFGKNAGVNHNIAEDKEEIRKQVYKIVEDMYSLKPSQVKDNASLQGILKINTLPRPSLS